MLGSGEAVIGDIMRRDFVSIGPGDSLVAADELLRMGRMRHLPVVHNGTLVGVLSHRDVLYATLEALEAARGRGAGGRERLASLTVEAVMSSPAWSAPATPLAEAAGRMLSRGLGCLPVVDGQPPRAIGLVTEGDLLRAAYVPLD